MKACHIIMLFLLAGMKKDKPGMLSCGESMTGETRLRMEQSGSDKAYSFCVPPSGKCCRVAVYEAAIETLAHMTLEGNRTDKYRLSVGGIYAPKDGRRKKEEKPPLALEHFLENIRRLRRLKSVPIMTDQADMRVKL